MLPFSENWTAVGLLVATVYVPAAPPSIDKGKLTAVPSGTVNCRACMTASGDGPPVESAPMTMGLAPSDRYVAVALSVEPAAFVSLIW